RPRSFLAWFAAAAVLIVALRRSSARETCAVGDVGDVAEVADERDPTLVPVHLHEVRGRGARRGAVDRDDRNTVDDTRLAAQILDLDDLSVAWVVLRRAGAATLGARDHVEPRLFGELCAQRVPAPRVEQIRVALQSLSVFRAQRGRRRRPGGRDVGTRADERGLDRGDRR